ncbi:16S rRNA (guanine(966)-N(2))-methyltransferase RsmD [Mycoplasmatota bacterium]|nr:16S rRNA (guanine(966)-N(2))-methyltransferase RsmD [Mycoplasmatota bacterium]
MLRVIAGKYKSRKIKDVKSHFTRPTTDKNKESIFNSIGQFFDGGHALDLYAGSGSLGIESLSRGIEFCDFVDKQFSAVKVIKENIALLNINDSAKVFKEDAIQFLQKTTNKYDLILLDPPYSLKPYKNVLNIISDRHILNENGIIVMESDHKTIIEAISGFIIIKEKILGQSKITILERESL